MWDLGFRGLGSWGFRVLRYGVQGLGFFGLRGLWVVSQN